MGVDVDEARRHHATGRIHLVVGGQGGEIAHGRDATAADRQIATEGRGTGPVDDRAIPDQKVAALRHGDTALLPAGRILLRLHHPKAPLCEKEVIALARFPIWNCCV